MGLDLNTLINLGILGVLAFLVRGVFDLRADIRAVKATLGINGHPDQGLVPRVAELGERSHDHANRITTLQAQMQHVRERLS